MTTLEQAAPSTRVELIELATRRFGPNRMAWAFVCPACGDEATALELVTAGASTAEVGTRCIGGVLEQNRSPVTRGCRWVSYGLVSGPWHVQFADGTVLPCFELAKGI